MKRSEMIAILAERFRHYENPTSIAEKALGCIENAGMLPPSVDNSIYEWEDEESLEQYKDNYNKGYIPDEE